jgi:hypothetical protein
VASTLTGGRKIRAAQAARAGAVSGPPSGPVSGPASGSAVTTASADGQAAVRGTVRDGQGHAVAGAVLTVIGGDGWQAGRAEVDAGGSYEITGVPLSTFSVIVMAPGHAPQAAVVKAADGRKVTHDFVLANSGGQTAGAELRALVAEAEVHGVVRGPQDTPVPGVTVSLANAAGDVVASAVTGEDGEYRLTGLDGGEHVLVATGYHPVSAVVRVEEGQAATMTVHLGPN